MAENCLPGNPASEWDVTTGDAGDPSIQGFGTDISVNQGATVSFKIKTDAKAYTINIYRMGYYGGSGARKVATVVPSAKLPQTQPACLTDSTTGLYDCGNWSVSASWQVPANATSGIYFAHLIRPDKGLDSHIVFIVRSDTSHSDMLFQTGDESWQAYNYYGGGSLYGPASPTFGLGQRAYKVSYNRPFLTRGFGDESATWVFGSEYPMIRWMESNGYDVSYFTGVDAARSGSLILNHKLYVTSGHDEYWSGPHRANVEAARNAGVNMAFFAGNEVFWKTRWENSVDGSNTAYRTLVCYKETLASAKIDPTSIWTGTWRDPNFSPPADGGNPENALTGTIFMVNGPGNDNNGSLAMKVPAADGKMRFWRNTSVASLAAGTTYTMPIGTLAYEWDEDVDNGARPAGAFQLSTSTYTMTTDLLLDFGANYGAGAATHHMMLYRTPGGARVFGSGTVQWAWGLDSSHDNPFSFQNPLPDLNMQQATINLFADMGVQPTTLQPKLIRATASSDKTAPSSTITSPAAGSSVPVGVPVTLKGTATDAGGVVGGVEVSVDAGTTWHPTTGRGSWTAALTPTHLGPTNILSRAVDDSGNIETPSSGVTATVTEHDCPCNSWNSSTTPPTVDSGDGTGGEFGVKFRADYSGYITGVRFFKSSANTGTHKGNLWSASGALLATATFTNETASGWQQVTFSAPVAISANTTYIASYFAPSGHYSVQSQFFATSGLDNPPVHLLRNGIDGTNGVYSYSSLSTFPASSFGSANYWVDVVYLPASSMPYAPAALVATPGAFKFAAYAGLPNPPSQSVSIYNQGSSALNWTASASVPWITLGSSSGTTPQSLAISVNASGLATGSYSGTVTISAAGAANSPQTLSVNLVVTNLLLSSNFASQGSQGWVVAPGGSAANWSTTKSALEYSGGGDSQIYAGNSGWTDYTVSTRFELSTLQNWPGGIRGRVNPLTGASYMLWAYPQQGQIILFKASSWSITQSLVQLGVGNASFDVSNYHTLGLSFAGTQIQALYDGVAVITVTDSTNTSGLVALEGDSQIVDFQSVVATSATPNTGALTSSPSALTFSGSSAGPNPTPQTVQLAGASGVLAWTATASASWITVTSTSGNTPASIQIAVNTSALPGGVSNGSVTVTSLGSANTAQVIQVSANVSTQPPSIVSSPAGLQFSFSSGQGTPPAQTLNILNGSGGTFSWTASSDSAWLSTSPASGSAPGSMAVSVNAAGLASGTYSGNIVVTAPGVPNSPYAIPVSLEVLSADMTESFTDGGSGWIVSPMGHASGWSALNGVYSYNGGGASQTCSGNTVWSDYAVDATVHLSSLSNWPGGLRARVNPATGAGYLVWLYPGSGVAVLYKVGQWDVNGSQLTSLGQASVSFNTNSHDLRMDFNGSAITVSWDGTALIKAVDAAYTAGFVCLDGNSQPISYSNLQVAAVQAPVTLAAPAPASLVFSAQPGASPSPQTITLASSGGAVAWAVTSSATWLVPTLSSNFAPGSLVASVNSASLPQGAYTATLTLSAPGATNSPITIPVTLGVKTAVLSAAPSPLTFFGALTVNPAAQNLNIRNLGSGTLTWSASAGSSWLGLSAASGSAPATLSVQPNTTTLATGSYTDAITVSSPDVTNSPATVPVSVQVGTLLFSDNFSSGAGNWTISPLGNASGWSTANSVYSYNGGGHTQSWAGSNSWTNYTAALDFQLASLNDYPGGLRGRVDTATGAGYAVWIYPAEHTLKLFRVDQWNIDSGNALLAQSSQISIDTNVHNLRLVFQGSTIQVYLDNALVITTTDSTYAHGAIALDVSSQPIAYSNVVAIGF